jgi:hypothetical protein
MAFSDEKFNLSKLLSRLQENRLAIKSITKLSDLNLGNAGRTQAFTRNIAINSASAISTTLIQVFLTSGLVDLPLTAVATINIWNIAKSYFSNTKLKSLMDKKLNFVVKKIPENSNLREELELLKDGIAVERRTKPKTQEEIQETKLYLGITKDNRIKKDEILSGFDDQVPDPITLDILLEMFKNGKSANYLKLKDAGKHPDKYIDLSPESKVIFNEILRELKIIEKNSNFLRFVKNNQQYFAGALAGGVHACFARDQQAKQEKQKDTAVTQAIQNKVDKKKLPPPNNSFKRIKYDPKKFGG